MTIPTIGEDILGTSGDDFYEILLKAHEGLSFEQSAALNARLLLILANELGDVELLAAAVERAANYKD